ncbi:MAG: Ku protein [Thermoproteota archaeon]|nr:Ku protein [Thermoproteota archaeon]
MAEEEVSPKRPIWSGTVTVGLVNVPVKLYSMIFDKGVSFRFLHKNDGQPLKYERVCTKDEKVVPWDEVVRGYEVNKDSFIVFDKKELDAFKPESDQRIRIDRFIDYLSVDPTFFERQYILAPDKNKEAYSLLLTALKELGKAGIGRITLRTKEYPAIVQPYKNALVLTTLRYSYEVADPSDIEDLKGLKEPNKKELEMAETIIKSLSGDFDITEYQDTYKEKIDELIKKKLKGEVIKVEKPVKEEAKALMVALQETLQQLKKK